MSEKPILFSGPMVKAILEGRKSQTRRPVKFQIWKETPVVSVTGHGPFLGEPENTQRWSLDHQTGDGTILVENNVSCPYGQPGDRLWVREEMRQSDEDGLCYAADGKPLGKWPDEYCYRNLDVATIPSIHMPRWASRITLEITKVRVERLREISISDCHAEGYIEKANSDRVDQLYDKVQFMCSWDSIYAARGFGWDKNPYVWVVEFQRI